MKKKSKIPSPKMALLLNELFPLEHDQNLLPEYLKFLLGELGRREGDGPRINGRHGRDVYASLIKKYSKIPDICGNPLKSSSRIVTDLFANAPSWRSPLLQYNVGAPTNIAATAVFALALEKNIYNINDGLAGNALVAEQAVTKILADLAGVKTTAQGLFTFGGTATNLYAIKIGTKKAAPQSGVSGMPQNLKVMVTRDSHFSHTTATDWLGIGTRNVVTIESNQDRRSNLLDAERKMHGIFKNGDLLATIIINGGTTYGHTVDDIRAFLELRDRMVKEYSLPYIPQLHVDSVIGWSWLFFNNYDFKKNKLRISKNVLKKIKTQLQRISYIKNVDSWGIDFHKGIGACPVACSMIMVNKIDDLNYITKKAGSFIDMHQLAPELSFTSPADFTLETSRPGGAALSALTSLHTIGVRGYQRNLANLIELSTLTKELLLEHDDIMVCNPESLGYVTMFRLYPPEFKNDSRKYREFVQVDSQMGEFIASVNKYTKAFFDWDRSTRMRKNKTFEYSFSSHYADLWEGVSLSAAKLYPVSPHVTGRNIQDAVSVIVKQKKIFDKSYWGR